ncbi:MAG: isoprenylcysteine carboxylmethyltransferase family protein [Anaerolineales bacterium]|jgi:protein-S-isoprenylcysteine O-methyltransferase Ste14
MLDRWVRGLAVAAGLIVILVPLWRVWRRRRSRRGRMSGSQAFLTRWPAVFALAVAYVVVGVLLWKPLPLQMTVALQIAATLGGTAFYFPGVSLYLWGFVTLGSMFGVSGSMVSELYDEHELIERGPYAFMRHPMYLGVLMAAVGALLIFRTWAMVLYTPSAFGIIFRARREDQLLEAEFGDRWRAYQARVPTWLPGISRRTGTLQE